jgi:hypothetical protein
MVQVVFLVLSMLGVSGCTAGAPRRSAVETLRVGENPTPEIREFAERMQRRGVITFRSFDGKEVNCCDTDVVLAFMPDDSVEMLVYGLGLFHRVGVYWVTADDTIHAEFSEFRAWPEMLLGRDRTSLFLLRADGAIGFDGEREHVSAFGEPPYWPFRMLTGDAETEQLRTLRRYAKGRD